MFNPVTYLHDVFRGFRLSKMDAEVDYIEKQDKEDLQKMLATDLIEVFDTHLLIDGVTYAECIIGGVTDEDLDGIPPGMTETAMERIMALSHEGARIRLCTGLIKIPRMQTSADLKEAYVGNSIDQKNAKRNTEGSISDLQLENEGNDIRATYNEIYYYSQNVYNASFIITLMGGEREVFKTKAQVLGVLQSELIECSSPRELMLPAFLAGSMYPISDERFQIKVHSDTAAILCTSTSINSTLDDEGMLFGKDKKTNAEVVVDLSSLPSQHMVVFGPTRSGKTFTVKMLLMRAHDMLGKRIVYITPKADSRTDYRAVAEYYGEDATIVDIGEFGKSINPLQIMYDPQAMGNSPQAYSSAYFRHIRTLKHFFAVWMADEFSSAAKGYLEDTLHKLYKSKGIIRTKPETWKNEFPVLSDLREMFGEDMDDKSNTSETRKSAGALYRKTSPIGEDGSLGYLNRRDNNIDFSKDYIVIDISGVDDEIKPAMYVLVTGIVGSRFRADLKKETIMAVDEARVFLRNPHLSTFLLDSVAMGGAQGMTVWLITQNPGDLVKNNVDEEFKTNMSIGIVMGATLDDSKVGPIKKYFNLSDSEVEELLQCQQGEGILRVRGETYPVRFEPTLSEYAIIKGLNSQNVTMPLISSNGYSIKPEFTKLVDHHHIILKEWITGNEEKLKEEGWIKKSRLPTIEGRGSCSIWHQKGAVVGNQVNIQGIGKMTLDHLVCVVQIESFLIKKGVRVETDHNNGADVRFWVGNNKYAVEYEKAHSHTIAQLVEKKGRLLEEFTDFRFSCAANTDEYDVISKGVGSEYMAPRGAALMQWLNDVIKGDATIRPSLDIPFVEEIEPIIEEVENEDLQKNVPDFLWKMVNEQMDEEKKELFIMKLRARMNEEKTGRPNDQVLMDVNSIVELNEAL
jgi:hypothetical protein